MVPLLAKAADEGLGIVMFHVHAGRGTPSLSATDLRSAERLLPVFQEQVPERPHGSVVFSDDGAAGLVLLPGERSGVEGQVEVRWIGRATETWGRPGAALSAEERGIFQRQALVVGEAGQRALKAARVVVVGLSGGGSHVVQQLAHLGFGEIIGIDDDIAERHHRHRLVGLTTALLKSKRRKTEVMKRLVEGVGTGSRFRGIEAKVPAAETIEAIRSADVVVGCVDSLHARADLQALAWRYVVPLIDIGLSIDKGERLAIGGNVLTLLPGGFCMFCSGFLSEDDLAGEAGGGTRNYFRGSGGGQAQVVSLNGVLASQAVNEVLQLLTGFGGAGIRREDVAAGGGGGAADVQRGYRKLDGIAGTFEDWGARRRAGCAHCAGELARGAAAFRPSPVAVGSF
jgi:hypothetical protein